MIRIFIVILMLLGLAEGQAFVTYVHNGNLLRWHLENGTYDSNLVNPNTRAIKYYISTEAYSAANREAELNAARACFDQWQAIPGTSLKFEDAGLAPAGADIRQDNTNVVFWSKSLMVNDGRDNISGKRGSTSVFLNTSNNKILEADIVLNAVQFQWFTDFNNTVNQAQFVESVLLHEVGHFIGLDHSPAGGSTVANGPNGIGTQAGLSADEIAAARYLYPVVGNNLGTIRGKVTLNGAGILGAMVIAEDAAGNIAGATVTRGNGDYEIPALNPGQFKVRVSPFDPPGTPNGTSLMRGDEVALTGDYAEAVTGFLPTGNTTVNVAASQVVDQNFAVTPGNPFRITSISKVSTLPDLVSLERNAVQIHAGQSNMYVSVSSPNLPHGGVLTVSGDGITMGPSVYKPNRFPIPGLHSITAPIHVSSNATPGLRTFVVTHNGAVAYANGYLEIVAPIFDYNFDGLDDKFQRQHFPRWTAPEAGPAADPDGDRFSNEFEYRTGSNPKDGNSYSFLIQSVKTTTTNALVTWKSEVGKTYQLFAREAFSPDKEWYSAGTVTATNTVTQHLVGFGRGGAGAARYFRLELAP